MKLERLIVIGAGAVGGCIGGLLFEAGLPTELVARGDHGRKIRKDGLEIQMPDLQIITKPNCVETIQQIQWRSGDVAMLATKLQDAESVLDELARCSSRELPVICATNGIQAEIWAATRFDTVIPMMIWMPTTHIEPGNIKLYSQGCRGVLDIGLLVESQKEFSIEKIRLCHVISEWLIKVGFDSLFRENIMEWKFAKWIANLGNAAQALVIDDWESVMRAAQAEGEAVLEASKLPRVPTRFLQDRIRHLKLEPIAGEKRKGGSTWQSFQQGKPLETKWIEGAMFQLAQSLGVETPVLRFLARVSEAPRKLTAAEVLGTKR